MFIKKTTKILLLLTLVILLVGLASASEVSDNTASTTDTYEMKVVDNIQQVSQTNAVTNEKNLEKEKIQSIAEDKNNKTLDKNVNIKNTKEATASDWDTLNSAVESAKQATSDTTITLQSGNYKTTNTITWNNNKIVLTIDGKGQTIDGNGQQVFTIENGCSLVLKNIIIKNANAEYGGAIYNNGTVSVINSTLQDNTVNYHGGAIYNNIGTLTVTGSILKNNHAAQWGGAIYNNGTLTVTNSTLENNNATYGGAIINWATLTVNNNSLLRNNNATYGGVIFNSEGTVTVTGSTLEKNNAAQWGGVIYNNYDSSITLTNNTLLKNNNALYGGAIISAGNLTVSDSTIESNMAYNDGGAIYNFDIATITGSTIESNMADNDGGAIYNWGTVSVSDSTFESNIADNDGGAIYNWVTLTVSDSTFESNNASSGGAIYNNGTLTVSDSTFESNNASFGGAIFNDNATVTLISSTLQNNNAVLWGGAIYNNIEANITVSNNSLLQNNTANLGGAIINGGYLTVSDSTFESNMADNGGAICNVYIVTITGSTLQNNKGITDGGAIYNYGILVVSNSTLENNNASSGGAINNYGNLAVLYSTLENNNATNGGAIFNYATLTVTDSTLVNNNASYGGAIYNNDTLNVTSSTLQDNTVNYHGAAIYNNNGTVTVTGSTLENNHAAQWGGALYNNDTLTVTNSKLINNNATYGGAIINWDTLTLNNNTLLKNNNATYGGVIFNSEGAVTVTGSTFEDNHAAQWGGAIYNNNEANITLTNNTLLKNNSALYGGAIINGGAVTVSDSTFESNMADNDGGAIYNFNIVTITGSSLQNNKVITDGGAIYNWGNVSVSDSRLENNSATNGGAISNFYGTLTVSDSTLQNNMADNGAAIYNDNGTVTITGNVFKDNHATNRETIDLNGSTDGKLKDNIYESTDINLTEIKLSLKDDKNTFKLGEDVILNYSIKLANPNYYKDFEDGINDITLYINDEKYITTKYENTTISNLKPGIYTVYFTSCNQQSNTVTIYYGDISEISTAESSYDYLEGVNSKIPLIIDDPSGLKGTIVISVKDKDEYKQLSSYYNVENGYKLSTEALVNSLENIYDTLKSSYTINVTYSSDVTIPSSTEFTLNIIQQRNSTITLDEISDAKYNENVTISGTLVNDDNLGLFNQVVTLTFGDSIVNVTTKAGLFEYTTVFKEMGDQTVTANYAGNDKYLASEATTTFNVGKQDVIVTYDPISDTAYGDNVTITGKFTDANQKAISNSNVNVYLNGKEYKARTDKTGAYLLEAKVTSIGTNNVTVGYGGNAYYNAYESSTNFTGLKQDVLISFEQINDTQYGENITVTGIFSDKNGKAISKSNVNVYINGKQYKAKTDNDGVFNITVRVTKVGTNNVTVGYGGNDYYNSYESTKTFAALKQDVKITFDSISDVSYGDNVTITGQFTEKNGRAISNSNVNVYINGKQYKARTDSTGKFNISVKTNKLGVNYVTLTYPGNAYYNSIEANTKFNAGKQNVTITVNPIKNVTVGKNVTITGRFTEQNGNPISNSNVNVYINGKQYKARTDSTGAFKLSVATKTVGTNNVTCSYGGNTYYYSCETDSTFNVIAKAE